MNIQEIRGLMEAYIDVYVPQEEIDEAVRGQDTEMRRSASAERRVGDKPLPAKEGEKYADFKKAQIAYIKRKKKMEEEVDLFDVVLEYLIAEGYADTNEAALAIMSNMSEEWRNDIIENVGSYNDPVLGPQSRVGQAVRTVGRAVTGAVRGAVRGAQDTRQG
jgi:hypothetical protein